MSWRTLFLAAVALLAAGCGGGGGASLPTTTAGTTATTEDRMALTVFRVRDGLLRPVVVHVPRTAAVAAAALSALGVDAGVSVSDGTATVDLARTSEDRLAEIVYTLTQFPTVQRVTVAGRTGVTRETVGRYAAPPILVESPAEGALVPQTFHVTGSASVFEATLVLEAVRGGKVLDRRSVTASEGAPGRGTFDGTLRATPGRLTVRAYAPSAADGSPQHEVELEVEVSP